jgi:hypothetical protein
LNQELVKDNYDMWVVIKKRMTKGNMTIVEKLFNKSMRKINNI